MGTRRILLPWDSQPQEVVDLNADDSRVDGLIGLAYGNSLFSLNGNQAITRGAPTVSAGQPGLGLETNGTDSSRYFAIPAVALTQWTVFGIVRSTNTALTDRRAVALGSTASVNQILSIGTHNSAPTKLRMWFRADDFATTAGDASTAAVFDGLAHFVVVTYDGTTVSLYVDGVLDSTDGTWVAKTATVNRFSIGALERSTPASYWAGQTFIGGASSRCWSQEEASNVNIWQLFAPRPIWVPVSGGGGASTITAATSVSAAIQAARTAAASVNAAIQAQASASASVNAAISQARTVQAALDAAVLQARSATASVDAAVQQALSSTADINAVIQAAQSASSGVDAAVVGDRSATTSINAYVQAGAGLVASLDAYIQAGSSAATSVGAAIVQTRTGNATIDAALQRALSATASLAAAVQEHRSATASISAQIQAGTAHSASLDAAIRAQQGASAAIGAAVSVARSASVSLGAAIAVHTSVIAAVQAAVLLARTGVASVGAYILDPSVIVIRYPSATRHIYSERETRLIATGRIPRRITS